MRDHRMETVHYMYLPAEPKEAADVKHKRPLSRLTDKVVGILSSELIVFQKIDYIVAK